MTIAQEAKSYVLSLKEWAQNKGGVVLVVPNLKYLWEQAYVQFEKPRVLFCFIGETPRGPFSRAAATRRVDRLWKAAVTRGGAYTNPRGSTLIDNVVNAEPFLDMVEFVRDRIRSSIDTSVEQPLDYKGAESMSLNNMNMDGYVLNFSTAHDLPAMLQTSPNNQPI